MEARGLLNHIETKPTKQCLTSLDHNMATVWYYAWRENLQVLDLQVFYEDLQVLLDYENVQVLYES